ncbi:MAG: ABC transporter permease subunit [Tissierellia bacterium]|nr:ABC transporter permease subunit [Tissierellia bacterium]
MKDISSNKPLKIFIYISLFVILAPMVIITLWAFTNQWPWPNLLPTNYSLRGIKEIFAPYGKVFPILISSITLSLTVALLSAIIAIMTARAIVFYDFSGKELLDFISMAPNLVPSTVFAMGIHVVLIRMSLANTPLGVIIVHLIYTLPYTINIMRNLTESIGVDMEHQAYVLGASPWKSFLYVSFPLLLPGIIASITMAYILSFSQYFVTLLIGGGKVMTFSMIMVPFIAKGDRTLGSAYALVFVLSTLLVFAIINTLLKKFQKREEKSNWN